MQNQINHPSFTAGLNSKGIVSIYYKAQSTSLKEDLKASYQAYLKLGKGSPLKVLYEIGPRAYFDMEAKNCLNNRAIIPVAEAIVSDSLAIRLVVDEYLRDRKDGSTTIRLFREKEAALAWLNTIEKKSRLIL
ncbi:MAG: hypothetical protein AB8B72_12940 [Crocinitomicaceae bacterium]